MNSVANKCEVRGLKNVFLSVHKHTHAGVHSFYTTHISGDHNIKADCECFVKCPIFSPVLCLEIFGESAFKEKYKKKKKKKRFDKATQRMRTHQEGWTRCATWSCSLWRRRSSQTVCRVAWKSTEVRISRCLGLGYTSTGCLFQFPRPEREG